MRVYMMTDLEGVAGVENSEDWCLPSGAWYRHGCELLTEEVNAAIRGFRRAGARFIRVVDGHGWGGITRERLDSEAEYYRAGLPDPYPFGLDEGFDVIAWVGQHAKAGATQAHLPHTGSFNVVDYQINGRSVGEFEQIAMCARLYGVTPILASGDQALADEAQAAFPGIRTVTVKYGLSAESGAAAATRSEYSRANCEAEHLPPATVRRQLEDAAFEALQNYSAADGTASVDPPTPGTWNRRLRLREHGRGSNVVISAEYPDLLTLLNDLVE